MLRALFMRGSHRRSREPRIAHSDRFPNRIRENQRVAAISLGLFMEYQERGVNKWSGVWRALQ
jgi:hypothetical protein